MNTSKKYSHVEIKDLGIGIIKKNLEQLNNSYTKVGFPHGAIEATGEAKSMAEVSTYAFYNEFGTKYIPSRPFMSTAFHANSKELCSIRDSLYKKLLEGKTTVPTALGLLGEWHTAKIKATIDSNIPPPNAPSTIRRKNAALMRRTSKKSRNENPSIGTTTRTLINFGQMRNSVTHVEVIK